MVQSYDLQLYMELHGWTFVHSNVALACKSMATSCAPTPVHRVSIGTPLGQVYKRNGPENFVMVLVTIEMHTNCSISLRLLA